MRTMILIAAAAAVLFAGAAQGRDSLHILSTPDSFRFTAMVGESTANRARLNPPLIEMANSRSSIQQFCAGVGTAHPDIIGVSRPMWQSEYDACLDHGVRRISEIKVGFDGIVLAGARGGPVLKVTKSQLFLALARQVVIAGKLVDNPYRNWREISRHLPDLPIRVTGPGINSDFGNAFLREVIDTGCRKLPEMAQLSREARDKACLLLRSDGAFRRVAKRYDTVPQELAADPQRLAVMPFSLYEQHESQLQVHAIDGVRPSIGAIAVGDYTAVSTYYIYVKSQHYEQVPGILEFVAEYTSDRAWAPGGYLVEMGMVPMSFRERIAQRQNAIGLNPMWR